MAWAKKYAITVDHTKCGATDSTSFPVAVVGTYAGAGGAPDLRGAGSGGQIQATVTSNAITIPADLAFYSDVGLTTLMPFEIDYWETATGIFAAHVQVSTLSHTADTVFYMAFGDSGSTTDKSQFGSGSKPWDASFAVVWHMSRFDRDSIGTYATAAVNTPTLVAGQVGVAVAETGTQYLAIIKGFNALSGDDTNTIEFWAKSSSFGSQPMVIAASTPTGDVFLETNTTGTQLFWGYRVSPATTFRTVNADISDGNWHHIAMVKTGAGDSGVFYLDGAAKTTASGALQNMPTGTDIEIGFGRYTSGAPLTWQGSLDELRISSVSRSADWVLATFNNQKTPSSFYTLTALSAPAFTASSPSAGVAGTAYTYSFTASGSPAPTFSVTSGAVPTGLSLSSAGVLSGTPTTAGTFTFQVTATNGVSPDANSGTLTIVVAKLIRPQLIVIRQSTVRSSAW